MHRHVYSVSNKIHFNSLNIYSNISKLNWFPLINEHANFFFFVFCRQDERVFFFTENLRNYTEDVKYSFSCSCAHILLAGRSFLTSKLLCMNKRSFPRGSPLITFLVTISFYNDRLHVIWSKWDFWRCIECHFPRITKWPLYSYLWGPDSLTSITPPLVFRCRGFWYSEFPFCLIFWFGKKKKQLLMILRPLSSC